MMKYIPSIKAVIGLTSSVLYCLRQGIVFWRTWSPDAANETQVDEIIEDALKSSKVVIDQVIDPGIESLSDGMTKEEYLDVVKNILEIREKQDRK